MNRIFHARIAWYQYFLLVVLTVNAVGALWCKYILVAVLFMLMLIVVIDMAQFIDVVMRLRVQAVCRMGNLRDGSLIDQPIQQRDNKHANEHSRAHQEDRTRLKDSLRCLKTFSHQFKADDRHHHTTRCAQEQTNKSIRIGTNKGAKKTTESCSADTCDQCHDGHCKK